MCSLCQRLGFVLFRPTDKAASVKRHPSTEGARNKRFSTSKVWKTDIVTIDMVCSTDHHDMLRYCMLFFKTSHLGPNHIYHSSFFYVFSITSAHHGPKRSSQ